MKLFKNILFALCAVCFLPSCEKEVIITLDNSADIKIQQTIDSYITTLSEARYGWLVDVDTNEGYYQFLMHFTDDNFVTMYTDNLKYPDYNARPKRSTYNIRSLQRITLSFDTYSYLAIINDPEDKISGGSGNQGLETDFDFEIVSYEDGVFNMTGRINRVNARMRKATMSEMRAVEDGGLMNSLKNLINYKSNEFISFSTNKTDVSIIFKMRTMDIAYFTENDVLIEETVDLNIRPTYDIELTESFDIEGISLTGFKWDNSKKEYSAVVGSSLFQLDSGEKSIIPFYRLFGYNKKYTEIASSISMYGSNMSNYIYRLMNYSSNVANATDANIVFITDESGNPCMRLTVYMNTGVYYLPVSYDYDITYNETGDEFTVGTMRYGADIYGYSKYLDVLLLPMSIIRYWENKTFIVDWNSQTYNDMKMGSVIEKENTQNFFPGIFQ